MISKLHYEFSHVTVNSNIEDISKTRLIYDFSVAILPSLLRINHVYQGGISFFFFFFEVKVALVVYFTYMHTSVCVVVHN